MTCHEVNKLFKLEASSANALVEDQWLAAHLAACRRCGEALKIRRLSAALLGALREEIDPGPSFYLRLRDRLAAASRIGRPDVMLLQAWGFARRLVPALALGVLLLAGVTISLGEPRSRLPGEAERSKVLYAFSLEELDTPLAVEQPSQDQMLAFVLMQGEARGTRSEVSGETSGK